MRLSAWMDEELPVDEACRLGCLDGDLPGLARSWDTWQIIGQALRQGGRTIRFPAGEGFVAPCVTSGRRLPIMAALLLRDAFPAGWP
ncbi:hypothetical protein [Laribacter hongkongensis]|uniref:hypothetical protein n=1 Tax=Laribacter hongkongensis TaxID=168471 RepID=UPI001EFE6518|nr:hypothetical protein [Laribacter hongkongensis]